MLKRKKKSMRSCHCRRRPRRRRQLDHHLVDLDKDEKHQCFVSGLSGMPGKTTAQPLTRQACASGRQIGHNSIGPRTTSGTLFCGVRQVSIQKAPIAVNVHQLRLRRRQQCVADRNGHPRKRRPQSFAGTCAGLVRNAKNENASDLSSTCDICMEAELPWLPFRAQQWRPSTLTSQDGCCRSKNL